MDNRMAGLPLWLKTVPLVVALALGGGCAPTETSDLGSDDELGGETTDGGGLAELQGTIRLDGSSTVYPMAEAICDAFKNEFPNVKTPLGLSGTGGGFKRFTQGETDVSNASRPIKDSEFKECQENGVSFIELPIAYDGLTIVVHPSNDFVKQLTVEQIQKIFLTGGANTWKDVDASWPEQKIEIFSPGTDSGTFDYFKEVVTDGLSEEQAAFRQGITYAEDDSVLVTGVAGQASAIGYFGAAYFFENQKKLRAVPIVNPEGKPVSPTPETIENGSYAPFSRPLFIYVKVDSLKRPEMKQFVEFSLEHAPEMAEKVGYVPLPKSVYDRAFEHYQKRLSGTHYLTDDGEKRAGPVVEVYVEENLNAGS
ncbi:MAG: PstS family phosphate ABC transporter substrate-binding protein [Pirellulaceae bacterium]